MNSRVARNYDFLNNFLKSWRIISSASIEEIGCIVEILYNIHKIGLNRAERNSIVKFLPIIRYIGKCRNVEKARHLLQTYSPHFVQIIVKAALSQ